MIKIAIIVLNYNGKEDTLVCLSSIEKQTYPHLEVILVDNGSSDSSVAAFKTLSPPFAFTLIENKENFGFAEGNNVGIDCAIKRGADACFLLNNDTELEKTCIEKLALFASSHPNAILGGRLMQFHNRARMDHLGGFWNTKTANFDLIGANADFDINKHGSSIVCDFVCGAAFFIPTPLLQKIGFLEPSFFLIWEESDFCMRAKKEGYPSIYCPEAIVYHKVSSSFSGGKPHTKYYWWRNRLLFMKRNLPSKDYIALMRGRIVKEIFHIAKLYSIKSLQIKFLSLFHRPVRKNKEAEVKLYKASLAGIFDYFRGHFGRAPSWLVKK